MTIQKKTIEKHTDTLEYFGISVMLPGISIGARICSLEEVKKDKMCTDIINYLNSQMDKKYRFD